MSAWQQFLILRLYSRATCADIYQKASPVCSICMTDDDHPIWQCATESPFILLEYKIQNIDSHDELQGQLSSQKLTSSFSNLAVDATNDILLRSVHFQHAACIIVDAADVLAMKWM